VALVAVAALSPGQAFASHVSCGQTLTANTTLDSDLIGCTGDGVRIGANGITLDLNGHTISASSSGAGSGVDDTGGYDNVTIENGLMRGGFSRGVYLSGVTGSATQGLDISGSLQGIVLFDSSSNVVKNNAVADANVGIGVFSNSDTNVVEENSLSGAASGSATTVGLHLRPHPYIATSKPDDNQLLENEVVGFGDALNAIGVGATQVLGNDVRTTHGFYGIYFLNSGQATIEDNRVYDSANYAIWVGGGTGFIRSNEVQEADGYAILLTLAATGVVEQNVALNNGAGLRTDGNSDATVVSNTFSSNDSYGILVDSTARVTLVDSNITNHNDDSGIEVNKAGSIVRMNTANYNGEYGIEAVMGVADGGGNKARGNDGPAQCLNVMCM
jgi:parallel beta-helix repeat protein